MIRTDAQTTVSELRANLAAVLGRVEAGQLVTVTRDGEPVAALLPPDEAVWCHALAAAFRDRRPPFTQANLDAMLEKVLSKVDLEGLLGTMG